MIDNVIEQVWNFFNLQSLSKLTDHTPKTFFSPDFEPKIALGHGALDFLADFCSRHSALLDATLSILQVRRRL